MRLLTYVLMTIGTMKVPSGKPMVETLRFTDSSITKMADIF